MEQGSEYKKCRICGELKIYLDFRRFFDKRDQKWYARKECKKCACEYEKNHSKNPLVKEAKAKAKKKRREKDPIRYFCSERVSSYKSKTEGSDLTTEKLIDIYNQQNGRCYYTNEELYISIGKDGSYHSGTMSLDKKDPEKGYVVDNVVFCCFQTNTSKGNRSESQFYDFCRNVIEISSSRSKNSNQSFLSGSV